MRNTDSTLSKPPDSTTSTVPSAIVEYILVRVLVDLIHYVTNKIIGSRLQGHKALDKLTQALDTSEINI